MLRYVSIARKQRNSENWFVGGVTNEHARNATINLSFLTEAKQYRASIYKDAANAHYQTNPAAYAIEHRAVTRADTLTIALAPGGGVAISLTPVN